MRFVDAVTLTCFAGHGGKGAVAFRREKYVDKGGPSGGNGGRGGDVHVVADRNVGTLLDLRYRHDVRAEDGQPGQPRLMDGRDGQDTVIRVPVGTLVRDARSQEILADLDHDGATLLAARGGRGGLGNASFKSSVRQVPRFAQPGEPGTHVAVTLELKLLADIGIIGFPSVGKSTLISVISNARPRIADYPFTTLTPNLGVVRWRDERSFVVADIPGLIEGAHRGEGLGFQFLRHIERCRALLHVIEVTPQLEDVPDGRDPIRDFEVLQEELERFSPSLASRPVIVALGKMDLPFVREREPALRHHFEALGHPFLAFSAATRDGLQPLLDALGQLVQSTPPPDVAHFTALEPDPERILEPEAEPTGTQADDGDFEEDSLEDGDFDGEDGHVIYVRDDD